MKTAHKKIGFILGTSYNPETAQTVANKYINKTIENKLEPSEKREDDPDTTRKDPEWDKPEREKENDKSRRDDDNDRTGPDTNSDKTK